MFISEYVLETLADISKGMCYSEIAYKDTLALPLSAEVIDAERTVSTILLSF